VGINNRVKGLEFLMGLFPRFYDAYVQ
jgi:hypothetical protein